MHESSGALGIECVAVATFFFQYTTLPTFLGQKKLYVYIPFAVTEGGCGLKSGSHLC